MASCLHPKVVYGALVPCGKCPNCRQNIRQDLTNRMLLETAFNEGPCFFVTLTYSTVPTCWDCGRFVPCFDKPDVVRFLKRLRKHFQFRYYLCAEYGDFHNRPHYHFIMWLRKHRQLIDVIHDVEEEWTHGLIEVTPATPDRMAYVSKYSLKESEMDIFEQVVKPVDSRKMFRLYSSRPGIGLGPYEWENGREHGEPIGLKWLNDYIYNDGDIRTCIQFDKNLLSLSRYLKSKLDPSLSAELKFRFENERYHEYQDSLQHNAIAFSKVISILSASENNDLGGCMETRVNNYVIDDAIRNKRSQKKLLKKLKNL